MLLPCSTGATVTFENVPWELAVSQLAPFVLWLVSGRTKPGWPEQCLQKKAQAQMRLDGFKGSHQQLKSPPPLRQITWGSREVQLLLPLLIGMIKQLGMLLYGQ